MTQNKKFKKLVRARMTETGETYAQARRALDDGRDKPVPLRLLGYWKHFWEQKWPDPIDLVDASWDAQERQRVINHLRRGAVLRSAGGSARYGWCRLGCDTDPAVLGVRKDFFTGAGTKDEALTWEERRKARHLASVKSKEANLSSRQPTLDMGRGELTDGVYMWPEGLAHYLEKHNVRLPQEFVDHVLKHPELRGAAAQTVMLDVAAGFKDTRAPERYEIDESWWLIPRSVITEKELTTRTQWSNEPPVAVQIESPFLPGWYFHDAEYPEEGSSGPYVTREEAETAAKLGDYELEEVTFWEQENMAQVFNRHMFAQIQNQVRDVADLFEGKENSSSLREDLGERLTVQLSLLRDRMEKEGVRSPTQDDIEIVSVAPSETDLKNKLLRYEVKIKDPHRYSQFVDALVSEGLLPMQSVVGMGLVEDA